MYSQPIRRKELLWSVHGKYTIKMLREKKKKTLTNFTFNKEQKLTDHKLFTHVVKYE